MSERPDTSGPQFRADRPVEQDGVRTTIVGGRPPGSGQSVGPIPRGIEVLVKKASVDPAFRQVLLEERAGAADRIGLELAPAEVMMLRAVPAAQLEAIIARTHVPQEHRRAFLGQVAAAMLAALGVGATAAEASFGLGGGGGIRIERPPTSRGVQPDRPEPGPQPGLLDERPPEKPLTVAERVFKILWDMFPGAGKPQNQPAQGPGDGGYLGRKELPPRPIGQRPEAAPHAQPGDKPQPPEPPVAPIPPGTRLIEDLGAKPKDLVALRKRLESEFGIRFPYGSFGRLKTVGQLVEYVETAVRRKEDAQKRRKPSSQRVPNRPQPQSHGIRPDHPPAAGGVRPN